MAKKCCDMAKRRLVTLAWLPYLASDMSAQSIREPSSYRGCEALLRDKSARSCLNRLNRAHDASQIRRFRRCDLRDANSAAAETEHALRKQLGWLRADEGLFVITSAQPRALVGELCNQGFDLRLEPAENGDRFLWLW